MDSATCISNCTIGKPLGGISRAVKLVIGSSEIKIPQEVDAPLVGEFFQKNSVFLHHFHHGIIIVKRHRIFCQSIQFSLGKPESFTDLLEYRAVLKLHIGAAKCHMISAVFFEDVFQNFIALTPTPIDIKIGR